MMVFIGIALQSGALRLFLQPIDQKYCLVPHLKDLAHIYFDLEVIGHGMTFKVCNLSPK